MKVEQAGDQCTLGCNFETKRPLRISLRLGQVFSPTAYAGRLLRLGVMLDRADRRSDLPAVTPGRAIGPGRSVPGKDNLVARLLL